MAAHDDTPDGTQPDAPGGRPGTEQVAPWLGDSRDFELRPGEHVAVDSEDAEEARRFRDVLGRYASGVTVVTTTSGGTPVGMTCQSFTSVSLEPPMVAFLPTRMSRAFAAVRRTGHFCVNFLAVDQVAISDQMASSGDEKFAGVDWVPSATTGSPLLAGTVGHVDCTVHAVHETGDHFLVIGDVVGLGAGEGGEPLLYHRGRYRTTSDGWVLGGLAADG